jgi:protein-S-isoprenylcysteine O-methyltransferase Ste14
MALATGSLWQRFYSAGCRLDALYHWSAGFPLAVEIAGLVLIAGGYILGSYAFIENAYFSGTVRIQDERGHRVVSSGPYGWMRHPAIWAAWLPAWACPCCLIRSGHSSRW